MSPTDSSPLVSVDELARLLDVVTVLDVRWRLGGPPGEEEHAAGHVPGARYVDLDTDLAEPAGSVEGGGRHPLPRPERFEVAMRRAGVSRDRPVVVYDDWQGRAASRAWWLLRHHGHPDVRVLDGGWAAWRQAGHPVETGNAAPRAGDFSVAEAPALTAVEAGDVLAHDVVIDAREPARYRGEEEPVDPVAGHIPGAANVPTSANLDDDGRFLDPAALRERYEAAGASDDARVAVYCGSGVTACHDLLAMEVAGLRGALYAASWSGWITDPDRPVERD